MNCVMGVSTLHCCRQYTTATGKKVINTNFSAISNISLKYLITGLNFSWMSHKKKIAFSGLILPNFCEAMFSNISCTCVLEWFGLYDLWSKRKDNFVDENESETRILKKNKQYITMDIKQLDCTYTSCYWFVNCISFL